MVVLNRIYTRKGDGGETRLADGNARVKSDLRIEAFGTVDEANACLGLARLHTKAPELATLDAMLGRIQNDLFDLGADLATPDGSNLNYEPLRVTDAQVERLERELDALNEAIPPLKSFILPGGSPAAAALHLARTVARRAERLMVALSRVEGETVSGPALRYANRVSDFLFVAGRAANRDGADDVLWVPGANR